MKVDVKMPKLGESLTEGTIIKWYKKVGDPVEKDETLLEVSTDKVDSEIPSPVSGTLVEILAQENETVEVESIIARIETEGEIAPGEEGQPEPKEARPEAEPAKEKAVQPPPPPSAEPAKEESVAIAPERRRKGRFYSPLVLNIARQEDISMEELEQIPGTGLNGRVTKKDLLKYLKDRKTQKAAISTPAPSVPAFAPGEEVKVVPMDSVLKSMAKHMRLSLDTSAHVYSVSECDMTRVMQMMQEKRPGFLEQEGFKLTVTPFILYAVVKALQDFPRMNASVEGDNMILHRHINLGVAVASPRGLIVPVIKQAEGLNLRGIARALNDLVTRAHTNKLKLSDIEGSTFSVTNYGVFGNIFGLPIINQPNVGILGIGAIKKRPVVIESELGDTIAIRSMAYLSLSFDHRIVDGELGGRFLERVVEILETFSPQEI